jgi:S1-C subfamily serine protease
MRLLLLALSLCCLVSACRATDAGRRGNEANDQVISNELCSINGDQGVCGVFPYIHSESKSDPDGFTCKKLKDATYRGQCKSGKLEGRVFINRITSGVQTIDLADIENGIVKTPYLGYVNYFPSGHVSFTDDKYSNACLFLDGRPVRMSIAISNCNQLYARFGAAAVSKSAFHAAINTFAAIDNLTPRDQPIVPATPRASGGQQTSAQNLKLLSTGSGFYIAKNRFVTNNHVIEGCLKLLVDDQPVSVVAFDEAADLALLDTPVTNVASVASIRSTRPRLGEDAIAVGFPLSTTLGGINISRGNISSLSGIGGRTSHLQFTAPTQPGNSGGPLLDETGSLIGVVVSKLSWQYGLKSSGQLPENVNFAVSASALKEFLSAYSIPYTEVRTGSKKSLPDVSDEALGFTRIVKCFGH